MQTHIALEVTRKGFPALWESGGATRSQSSPEITARVIAGRDGYPMRPVFVPMPAVRTHYGGKVLDHFGHAKKHALFVIREGTLLFEAAVKRRDFHEAQERADVRIYRVLDVSNRGTLDHLSYTADIELVNRRVDGEWKLDLKSEHARAVQVVLEKLVCECHGPHYADCRPEQVCRHLRHHSLERLPDLAFRRPHDIAVRDSARFSSLSTLDNNEEE